jgi:hypothetical protein
VWFLASVYRPRRHRRWRQAPLARSLASSLNKRLVCEPLASRSVHEAIKARQRMMLYVPLVQPERVWAGLPRIHRFAELATTEFWPSLSPALPTTGISQGGASPCRHRASSPWTTPRASKRTRLAGWGQIKPNTPSGPPLRGQRRPPSSYRDA